MSGWEARYVRSAGYVRARGRTCPVITDLELPGRNRPDMSSKGADMSSQIRIELIWKTLEIQLSKDLTYGPIVVHILVINGQVLKSKTYIWLEINKIIKHA
jgi:hypothetical protein